MEVGNILIFNREASGMNGEPLPKTWSTVALNGRPKAIALPAQQAARLKDCRSLLTSYASATSLNLEVTPPLLGGTLRLFELSKSSQFKCSQTLSPPVGICPRVHSCQGGTVRPAFYTPASHWRFAQVTALMMTVSPTAGCGQ